MRRSLSPDQKIGYGVTLGALAVLLATLATPAAYIRLVAAVALVITAAAVCVLVKKRRILSFYKRQILLLIAIIAAVYLMLLYMSGIVFGFTATVPALSPDTLWRFILPGISIIIATEMIRTVLLSQDSKVIPILLYVTCLAAELTLGGGFRGIDTMYRLMQFTAFTAFPAVTANLLYNYLSKRYGMAPVVVFRLILFLSGYLIPVTPSTPPALTSFALLILPLIVYLFIDKLYEKKIRYANKKIGVWRVASGCVILALMISVVMLISCQFRYGALVIATESMTGTIDVGDAVVYEQYDGQALEAGDVIVFWAPNQTRVVHRIEEIVCINGQNRYYTKGDANDVRDVGYLTDAQVIGVVQFRIVSIGYPSLWVRSMFK